MNEMSNTNVQQSLYVLIEQVHAVIRNAKVFENFCLNVTTIGVSTRAGIYKREQQPHM